MQKTNALEKSPDRGNLALMALYFTVISITSPARYVASDKQWQRWYGFVRKHCRVAAFMTRPGPPEYRTKE